MRSEEKTVNIKLKCSVGSSVCHYNTNLCTNIYNNVKKSNLDQNPRSVICLLICLFGLSTFDPQFKNPLCPLISVR